MSRCVCVWARAQVWVQMFAVCVFELFVSYIYTNIYIYVLDL